MEEFTDEELAQHLHNCTPTHLCPRCARVLAMKTGRPKGTKNKPRKPFLSTCCCARAILLEEPGNWHDECSKCKKPFVPKIEKEIG